MEAEPFDISPDDAVMAAFSYADVFNFPLKLEEAPFYIPFRPMTAAEIADAAHGLRKRGRLCERDGYWLLPGREQSVVNRRDTEPMLAEKWSRIRRRLPPLLGFSWVKAVMLTGSLAAKNPTGEADADLLLVLDHRRMWLGYLLARLWCRMGRDIEFCPNYAISDRSLPLMFENLFTAVELGKAIPLKDNALLDDLERENAWSRRFLPNAPALRAKAVKVPCRRTVATKLVDFLVRSPLGWALDRLERWRLNRRTAGLFQPKDGVYKPHPPARQCGILESLLRRLDRYDIAAPGLRRHLLEQCQALEDAGRGWTGQPSRRDAAPKLSGDAALEKS